MRKRNIRFQFWLDEKESEKLRRHVARSGLPREAYLRHLINNSVPTDKPPPDYFTMMTELRRICAAMHQIAQSARTLNILDAKQYDNDIALLNAAIVTITNAVMLPRRME